MVMLLKLLARQELPDRERSEANCTISSSGRGMPYLVGFLTFAVTLTPHAHGGSPLAGQFASGVSLVEVYANVFDAQGQPITGLTADDFHVSEDGEPQRITTFAAGEFPLSVAIGIDRSFSMAGQRLALAKAAARTFLDALRPDDQVTVLAVGSEPRIVAPLSSDRAASRAAIDRLDPWGTTPLYDATVAALDAIQPAKGRRALVLISDGRDRYSRTTAADLLDEVRRRDVLIYPIAIGGARPAIFAELSTATGGRTLFVKDPRELRSGMATIARDLRLQYLLGYTPSRPPSAQPEWHAIQVDVARPNVHVRARDGYHSR
jgi:Ca-activated chloride channel family protein